MTIDLHMHSNASDGSYPPEQLVTRAKGLHLTAIAITDHDTVDAVVEALGHARSHGLGFVSGIELSAAPPSGFPIPGSLHVLGYGIDPEHPELCRVIAKLKAAREERIPRILEQLRLLHLPVSTKSVESLANGATVGRPHIARAMVEAGMVSSVDQAFDRYLGHGKPAYVDKYRIPMNEALGAISMAGGVSVLAHPGLIPLEKEKELMALLDSLRQMGLEGIEAHYPEHSARQTRFFTEWAAEKALFITGGTDFHGSVRPGIEMGTGAGGFHVPDALFKTLVAGLKDSRFWVPPSNGDER